MASEPITNVANVVGMARRSPPMSRMSLVWQACRTVWPRGGWSDPCYSCG